jgi:hypothetical protein
MMKKTIILLIGLMLTLNYTRAQKSLNNIRKLDSIIISHHTYTFSLKDGTIQGDGARVLRTRIAQSQFFVLGEYHGSSQISKLTKILVPELEKNNYSVAVFEVGTNSANKLTELSQVSNETVKKLYQFNTNYYSKEQEDTPIPFFSGIEDAEFLASFSKANFQIWGCDQEYYLSILFLGDEIVKSTSKRTDYELIKQAWISAKESIDKLFIKDMKKDIEIFEEIKSDKDFKRFTDFFTERDTIATNILNDLYDSWYIYTNYRVSHRLRVDYIRKTFMNKYLINEIKNPQSKYFIKIGGLHTGMTEQSRGYYDIGELTQELAGINNTISTNIKTISQYYDNEYSKGDEYYFSIFGHKDQWTLIDTKSLREKLQSHELTLLQNTHYHEIKDLIEGYDIILITPNDTQQKSNYSISGNK